MPAPMAAIVGRPNVGKSSLLNSLSRRRTAIVTDTSGTTRDPVCTTIDFEGRQIELIDTGGMGMDDAEVLAQAVTEAIRRTLEAADLILFVVDIRTGLLPLDTQIAALLRTYDRKVLLVANKADTPQLELHAADFYALGLGEALPVSARENLGRYELLEAIAAHLPQNESEGEQAEPIMKLAIVGKRNTGKSTFANALVREERMIVSDLPGTTRDSVDIRFEKDGKAFLAIDTAGLRKKIRIDSDIEQYSAHRTERAIRRADVALFFLDAEAKISRVDKKICSYIEEQFKPCAIVVNKWDLAGGIATGQYVTYLETLLRGMAFAPILFISAKTGARVDATIDIARSLHKQASVRVTTAVINECLEVFRTRPLRATGGKKAPKIYFGTQVSTAPPLIVLSVNHPGLFSDKHRRTILNHLREVLPFHEVPIKLRLRSHWE